MWDVGCGMWGSENWDLRTGIYELGCGMWDVGIWESGIWDVECADCTKCADYQHLGIEFAIIRQACAELGKPLFLQADLSRSAL